VDAEKQLLSSFAAFVVLFHFLVVLLFENCFCFCQWCSRRTTEKNNNNGRRNTLSSSSSSVFEEQQQQIFPVVFVAVLDNEKTVNENNNSESYEGIVFRVASSCWSSVGFVFGGGFIVVVCVLINKHGLRGVDSRRGGDG